jgi:hypothetical protein
MHRTISRSLLAVLASLIAVAGLASPSQAVTKLTDAQAASQLSAAGITRVSTGGCTDRNVATCTSYDQINQETVSGISTFRSISGCAITITGGTETGHADGPNSHWNGYKVDVRPTACVTDYITGHYAYSGTRSDGAAIYTAPSGNVYAREGSHWDITYLSCGC